MQLIEEKYGFRCELKKILKHGEQGLLANKIGLSKSAMSSLVNGHSLPSFIVAYMISEELKMDFRQIWIKEEKNEKYD